ncbi:acyl-CoA-binding protein [Pilobolus umbonatus]|nr:acyl-CoA-binding protein [Pilobolus umbonatus]
MDEICQDDQWFEQAFTYMNKNDISLSNEKKLHFYGLFKQATIGDCNKPKPGLFEFVDRAKWDAWNRFRGMSFRDARNLYIESVERLEVGWSRKGEYEYIPSALDMDQGEGSLGVSVSSMAVTQEKESDDIFGYTRENNLDKLKEALDRDSQSIDTKNDEGLTVLHLAADRGYVDIVKYIIKKGADMDARSDDKETALHYGN